MFYHLVDLFLFDRKLQTDLHSARSSNVAGWLAVYECFKSVYSKCSLLLNLLTTGSFSKFSLTKRWLAQLILNPSTRLRSNQNVITDLKKYFRWQFWKIFIINFTSSSDLTSAHLKFKHGCSGRNWCRYQAFREST